MGAHIDQQLTSSLALAFAGGVMLYTALVAILAEEAKEEFTKAYENSGLSHGELETEVQLYIMLFFAIGFGATYTMITQVFRRFLLAGHGSGETSENSSLA